MKSPFPIQHIAKNIWFFLTPYREAPAIINSLKDWLDFSLLPPFDKVARYFGISVFAGSMTRDGYLMKVLTPVPATARR